VEEVEDVALSIRRWTMEDKERMVFEAMKKAGRPVRPGDIATMTGMDSKEVSVIINALKKRGKVSSPKRCFYAPTEE
jgi:ATP-dependent exoDNAse (exonuclease V) beta subunit